MARIVIDGYNLLAISGHKDRDALVTHLADYQKQKSHQVLIVFDGTHRGTGTGDRYHFAGVEVLFSPLTITADELIEGLLHRSVSSGWIVVSSDRRIQSAALAAGAVAIRSEEFATRLRNFNRPSSSPSSPPWLEGRTESDDDSRLKVKKGSSRKLSKKNRLKKRKLERL